MSTNTVTSTIDPTDPSKPFWRRGWFKQYGGMLCGLAGLVVLFAVLSGSFLSVYNLTHVVLHVCIIAIPAFGMTYVLLLGEIGLSVGSMIALVGTVAALAMSPGFSVWRE